MRAAAQQNIGLNTDLPELAGIEVVVIDLGIEQTRTRDWVVTKVAARPQRRLGRRGDVYIADWNRVAGLTPSGLAMPDQGVAQLLEQFQGQRAIEVAERLVTNSAVALTAAKRSIRLKGERRRIVS